MRIRRWILALLCLAIISGLIVNMALADNSQTVNSGNAIMKADVAAGTASSGKLSEGRSEAAGTAVSGKDPESSGKAAVTSASNMLPGGYVKVAETDEIALYYTPENFSIAVQDKRNGYIWSSAVDPEKYGMGEVNPLIKRKMSAPMDFKYTSVTNKKYAIVSVDHGTHRPEISTEMTQNGINVLFKYSKLGFTIPVNLSLEKNALVAEIPAEAIKEEGDYHLISLELFPFLGASHNTEQGYMFYPDGSGALFRFKNEPRKEFSRTGYYIYGPDEVDLRQYRAMEWVNIKPVMLPVFGVKKEDNAFLAVIAEGEYDTCIYLTPSGFSNIHMNRISPEFTYRRTFKDLRDDPNIPARIESEMLKIDRKVRYYFLADDEADYSGMANEYRNYLIEKGDLVKKLNDNDGIPMGLGLFMGIKEERILFDKFVRATTFKQAEAILESFSALGVGNMQVNLIGWSSKGYGESPTTLPPNNYLGGTGGLKELAKYAKEKGYRLYLHIDLANADRGVGGFSIRNDTVYARNGLIVSNNSNNRFLLNPMFALNKFKKSYIPKLDEYGIEGLIFEFMGKQLYHDYNKRNPMTRRETAESWQEMLRETAERLGSSGTAGGNAYVLKNVDRLFDIPVADSGNILTNDAVPFYQMVVHGYVPYSSDPGNLFYDYNAQKLKWVEYGCMPYFELTYEKSDVLKYTDYNLLFSSHYRDWLEIASDTYKEFNERLRDTWSKCMVEHRQVRDGVYEVVYDDGTRIYINYNPVNVIIDGYMVNAVDYLVIDKGGNVR